MPVSLQKIDEQVGGRRLLPDMAKSVENACEAQLLEMKDNQRAAKLILRDVERLLALSKQNLESVKNQKWFQRVWHTVTGKNKKLERVNQTNLVRVQKAALYFLAQMAEREETLSDTVVLTLERLEDLQIDNLKVRAFLVELSRRVAQRLRDHDERLRDHGVCLDDHRSRLDEHAAEIRRLGGNLKEQPPAVNPEAPPKDSHQVPVKVAPRLKSRLKTKVANWLLAYVEASIGVGPFWPYLERHDRLVETLDELDGQEELESSVVLHIIEKSLRVKANVSKDMHAACSVAVNEFNNLWDEMLSAVRKEYMPRALGFEAELSLTSRERTDLKRELRTLLRPYFEDLEELEQQREELLALFPAYRDVAKKSGFFRFARGGVKGFLGGLLLGPVGVGLAVLWEWRKSSDEEETVRTFSKHYETYIEKWDVHRKIFVDSVWPAHNLVWKNVIRRQGEKTSRVAEEFALWGEPIEPLLTELDAAISEVEAEGRS